MKTFEMKINNTNILILELSTYQPVNLFEQFYDTQII